MKALALRLTWLSFLALTGCGDDGATPACTAGACGNAANGGAGGAGAVGGLAGLAELAGPPNARQAKNKLATTATHRP